MALAESDFQQISTVNSGLQPKPVTIVAALTIAPTTFLTLVAGTTAVATITPPLTSAHMLAIVASTSNFIGFTTAGNILVASITNSELWTNKMNLFVYNPLTAKYYPSFAVHNTLI